MLQGWSLKDNAFTKTDTNTTIYNQSNRKSNRKEHNGIKVADKSCLVTLSILHHGLTTMATSALNTWIQQPAKHCPPKAPILLYYQPCAPASDTALYQTHNCFPWPIAPETAKRQERD